MEVVLLKVNNTYVEVQPSASQTSTAEIHHKMISWGATSIPLQKSVFDGQSKYIAIICCTCTQFAGDGTLYIYIYCQSDNCCCLVCSLQRSMWPKYILQISCYCFYALYMHKISFTHYQQGAFTILWPNDEMKSKSYQTFFTIAPPSLLYSRNIPSLLCLIYIVVVLYYQLK